MTLALKLVLDATPLIHAAKTRLHTLLKDLDVECFTTPQVAQEVLSDGEFEEKGVLKRLLSDAVEVLDSKEPLAKVRGLHAGEASALALAKTLDAVLVYDDRVARTVAKAQNIPVVHTSFLIFRALEKKAVTPIQAQDLVTELLDSGWWCDAQTLNRIHNAIRQHDPTPK